MNPRFSTQTRKTHPPIAARPGTPAGDQITTEIVEGPAIGLGAQYYIRGTATPTRGTIQLQNGDAVSVLWRKGKPFMILNTQRLPGSGHDVPPTGGSPVEELYVAQRRDSVWDVFFRNALEHVPLRIPETFGIDCSAAIVKWGPGNNRFFINVGTVFHIMKFARATFKGFDSTGAAARLSRERIEDVSTNTMVLAHVTFPTTFDITVNGVGGKIFLSWQLDMDGNLIGSWVISVGGSDVPDSKPGANFDSSLSNAATNTHWSAGRVYPVIADVTNRVILLSGFDDVHVLEPFVTFTDWNGASRGTFTSSGINVTGIVRPVTWVAANSYTETIDPPFEGHTTITLTWQFGYSADPSDVLVFAEPILVLGVKVPTAQRIRGLMLWRREVYNIFIGQTFDVADWTFFLDSDGGPGWNPIAPTPPFPVTDQTAIAATSPLGVRNTVDGSAFFILLPLQRPAFGVAYAPTYNRIVWVKASAVTFHSKDEGLDITAAAAEGFMTFLGQASLTGSANQHVSFDLRQFLAQHGFNIVPTDFLYKLDNPVIVIANEKQNFFANLWSFAAPSVALFLIDSGHAFYKEDSALKDFGGLKALLPNVTPPTQIGLYSLQIVNDSASLPGHFETIPTA